MGLETGSRILGYRLGLKGAEKWTRDFGKADRAVKTTDATLGRFQKKVGGLGGMLKKGLALAAPIASVMALKKALNEGIQDMEALARVGTLLKPGTDAFRLYTREVTNLERETGIADEVLAGAMYSALQLGVGQNNVMGLLTQSARTAESTFQDVDAVIQGTGKLINSYKLNWKDTNRIQNQLYVGVRNGAGDFQSLGMAIGEMASTAKVMGMEYEELIAITATLGQSGIRGTKALMGVGTALVAVANATPRAKEEAKKLGIEWSGAALQSKGFTRWLQELRDALDKSAKAGGNTAESMANLGLSSRTMGLFSNLLEHGEVYNGLLAEIRSGHDEIAERWNQRQQEMGHQMKRLSAATGQLWESFGIGIADGMLSMGGLNRSLDDTELLLGRLTEAGKGFGVALADLVNWAASPHGLPLLAGLLQGALVPFEALARFVGMFGGPGGGEPGGGGKGIGAEEVGTAMAGTWMASKLGVFKGLKSLGKGVPGMLGTTAGAVAVGAGAGIGVSLYPRELGSGTLSDLQRGGLLANKLRGQGIEGGGLGDLGVLGSFLGSRFLEQSGLGRVGERLGSGATAQALEDLVRSGIKVMLNLDHQVTDKTGKNNEHKGKAQASGAGRAEINVGYRFHVYQPGQGIHAVRPLPANVTFAHIRPSE